jgi:hypothetical protein
MHPGNYHGTYEKTLVSQTNFEKTLSSWVTAASEVESSAAAFVKGREFVKSAVCIDQHFNIKSS